MEYQTGHWVKIVDRMPRNEDYTINSWLGTVVRIATMGSARLILDDVRGINTGMVFNHSVIERGATEEEIREAQKVIIEIKKAKEALKEGERTGLTHKCKDVAKIAEDIFGQERVKYSENDVIIHFPIINMENSNGTKHIVRDLYVKYSINVKVFGERWEIGGYKANIGMSGLRGSLSLKEYESGYGHSHMSTGNLEWAGFCFGKSEYSILMTNIQLSLLEQDWIMLFLSLENYLNWESLEGGPYSKTEDLRYKKTINNAQIEEEFNRISADAPRNVWDFTEGGLVLNTESVALKEYFNSVSKLRNGSSYEKQEAEKALKKGEETIKNSRRNVETMWGKKKIDINIYYEEAENNEKAQPVSKDILEQYNRLLSQKGQNFIKTYTYGKARRENREKVFGQSGTHQ